MTSADIVARARQAVGLGIAYSMGSGAHDPSAPTPAGDDGACDCSGFVDWVLGTRRYRPDLPWLVAFNGGWLNTDSIWHAARGKLGLLIEGPALLGSVIVYPSAATAHVPTMPRVGHIGIVTEVGVDGRASRVVHCSSGNFHLTTDAIQETAADVFLRREATLCAVWAG